MTPREEQLLQENEQLRRENALLRQKVDALARRFFGSSSEKLDRSQLELLLQLAQCPAPELKKVKPVATAPKGPARSARGPRLPDNLPVVEEVIDPEPVQAE